MVDCFKSSFSYFVEIYESLFLSIQNYEPIYKENRRLSLKTDVNLDYFKSFHHINKIKKHTNRGHSQHPFMADCFKSSFSYIVEIYESHFFSVFKNMNPFIKRTGVCA